MRSWKKEKAEAKQKGEILVDDVNNAKENKDKQVKDIVSDKRDKLEIVRFW